MNLLNITTLMALTGSRGQPERSIQILQLQVPCRVKYLFGQDDWATYAKVISEIGQQVQIV
jgi:hypothetical protein